MSDADAVMKRWVVERTTVGNVPLVTQVTIADQKKRAQAQGVRREQICSRALEPLRKGSAVPAPRWDCP